MIKSIINLKRILQETDQAYAMSSIESPPQKLKTDGVKAKHPKAHNTNIKTLKARYQDQVSIYVYCSNSSTRSCTIQYSADTSSLASSLQ